MATTNSINPAEVLRQARASRSIQEWIPPLKHVVQSAVFGFFMNAASAVICTRRLFSRVELVGSDAPVQFVENVRALAGLIGVKNYAVRMYSGKAPHRPWGNTIYLPADVSKYTNEELDFLIARELAFIKQRRPLFHVATHWTLLGANLLAFYLPVKRAIPAMMLMNGTAALLQIWSERRAQLVAAREAMQHAGREGAKTFYARQLSQSNDALTRELLGLAVSLPQILSNLAASSRAIKV